MREIFSEHLIRREKLSKSEEASFEHIRLDKEGLTKYLNDMCDKEAKFISFSAKICGNSATYDIVIEKSEELTCVPNDVVDTNSLVGEVVNDTSSINKTLIHVTEGAFLVVTGRKLEPGDFFFEKVLMNGEFVDLPVNVKKVVNGVGNLYQIITDEDGTWGYNI